MEKLCFLLLVGSSVHETGRKWDVLRFHTADARGEAAKFIRQYDGDAIVQEIYDWKELTNKKVKSK